MVDEVDPVDAIHHLHVFSQWCPADQIRTPHEQPEFRRGHQVAEQIELVEKGEVVEGW